MKTEEKISSNLKMTIPIEDTADEVRSRPDTEDENISVTRPMLYERSEMELQVTLEQ